MATALHQESCERSRAFPETLIVQFVLPLSPRLPQNSALRTTELNCVLHIRWTMSSRGFPPTRGPLRTSTAQSVSQPTTWHMPRCALTPPVPPPGQPGCAHAHMRNILLDFCTTPLRPGHMSTLPTGGMYRFQCFQAADRRHRASANWGNVASMIIGLF